MLNVTVAQCDGEWGGGGGGALGQVRQERERERCPEGGEERGVFLKYLVVERERERKR